MVTIRAERAEDIAAIRAVNQQAFGQPQEAQLVDALRANGGLLLSLVATLSGCVVGHIAYSPVTVGTDNTNVTGAGLGPMAVLPAFQRRGIGGMLIKAGNQQLRDAGYPFIVLVGHPEYYPRFGFEPAGQHGLHCEWDVPDNVFMVLILDAVAMQGVVGVVQYREEFSGLA